MPYAKTTAVIGLAFLSISCAPKGAYQQAAATGRSLDDTRTQLITTKTQISQTIAALDDLVQKPHGDLKDQYKAFADNVDKLNRSYSSTRDRVLDIRSNRDAYVAQWQTDLNTLTSETLRERARSRMDDTKANFSKLGDSINAVNNAAAPLLADVNDLKRYFGGDLTATGVKSAPDIVTRTHTEAADTQMKIDDALVQLDTTNKVIAPVASTQVQ